MYADVVHTLTECLSSDEERVFGLCRSIPKNGRNQIILSRALNVRRKTASADRKKIRTSNDQQQPQHKTIVDCRANKSIATFPIFLSYSYYLLFFIIVLTMFISFYLLSVKTITIKSAAAERVSGHH